jgi:asparagine synthase (glutamine-hydrolysing)
VCGICGLFAPDGIDRDALVAMNRTLTHRGPDDAGHEDLGQAGLAARRLSIIDVEGGHQPIFNEDRSACIAFNGEIYNYRELRRELLGRGHRFETATDTEVVLHLWEEEKERVVERLEGMFAFAIWDARGRRLLLARDRFGQKPLYWTWDGDRFLFGSEMKAILAGLRRAPEPNLEALDDFLTLRFVPSPDTMFAGIHKLPAAHLLTLHAEPPLADGRPRVEIRRYWQLRYEPKPRIDKEEAVRETREHLRRAVESHLVSDVEVGAFLSGGMDSSLVVALMSELTQEPVTTCAVGVRESDFNELPYARQVAEHCGTRHHEETVWPDLVGLLPKMLWHLEEPSDPIAACMYHAAALGRRHVKVVLTGDGGDEMFAGFDRYWGFRFIRYYAALPAPVRRGLLGPVLRSLPESSGYKTFTQKARWVHDLSFHDGGRRYAEATAFFRFGGEGKAGLYGRSAAERLAGRDATECIVAAFDEASAVDDLDRMLSADIDTRLTEHSLMLTDRMTMAHGLEARPPLLDHRLAEAVARMPASLKIRRGRLKHLLRRACEPWLPREILERPKQGFMFPLGYWMKGPLVPVLRELADDSVLVESGIFRREAILELLDEHLANRADHHVRLWMLLNVEIWYRMYLLGQSPETLAKTLEERVAAAAS